ncbi:MAG: radical SAM protein [Candidatus Omnitrophica bacterium]|nr:radical SAM protein [Candidatus Omnitrophota bacterium]
MKKSFLFKIIVLLLLTVLVCPINSADIFAYAKTDIVNNSTLSPLSLFDFVKHQNYTKTEADKDLFLKLKFLDLFLQDNENIKFVFDQKLIPALGEKYKSILEDVISFESLPVINGNIAQVKVKLLGKKANLYFFKDKDSVIQDNEYGIKNKHDLAIAVQRRYWFDIRQYQGEYYENISLTHKGTKEDPLQIVLVMPRSDLQESKPTRLPAGLMSLASCLQDKVYMQAIREALNEQGLQFEKNIPEIKVSIIDLQAEKKHFDLKKRLQEIKPDIVAVTAVTPLFDKACEIASIAQRTVPSAIRIIGGVHISAISKKHKLLERTMFDSDFQIGVTGEGEQPLSEMILRLFEGKDIGQIPNTAVKRYAETIPVLSPYILNESHIDLVAFEDQPLPCKAFDLLNIDGYEQITNPDGRELGVLGVIFSSRGCPFNCSFCASRAVFHKKVKFLSPERIFEEMRYYYQKGVKGFYIMDDNFCIQHSRIKKLADMIEASGMDIEYSMMARADSITEDLAKDLKRSGCKVAALGVESGDDNVLKAINKRTSVDVVAKATRILQKQGIHTKHFLMVGLPKQDWSSIRKTVEFILRTRPDSINISVTMPYPGSDLYSSNEIHLKTEDLTQFVHEPEPQRKKKANVNVITSTDAMNSSDIARARMLLLEVFQNMDDQRKVDSIMSEIDERIIGTSSAGNILKRVISDNILFDHLYYEHSYELEDFTNKEKELLFKIGILDKKVEGEVVYCFSNLLSLFPEEIKKFLTFLIQQDNENGACLFNVWDPNDEKKVLNALNFVRVQAAHFLFNSIKEQEKENCNIVLWKGYGGAIQESLLSRISKDNRQDSISLDFKEIDDIVNMIEEANKKKKQVFLLPYSMLSPEDRSRLNSSGANIIYADVADDFSKSFSVNIIEGLITAGYAYLQDNEDVFYTAFAILTQNKKTDYLPLSTLKKNPSLFFKKLKFIIEPIKAEDIDSLRYYHKLIEKLLVSA